MSNAEDSTARKALRTVTPSYRGRPDEEMNLIGITYFLVLLVVLVPLLPFVLIVWILSKAFEALHQRTT